MIDPLQYLSAATIMQIFIHHISLAKGKAGIF